MTDAAQVALLVLAGLLTGLLVPVLLSARAFFKRTEQLVERLEPRLGEALDEVRALVHRSDTVVESLAPAAPKVSRVVDSLDRLADGVEELRASSAVASSIGRAIGPAVIAAWSAYRAHRAMEEFADSAELDVDDTTSGRDAYEPVEAPGFAMSAPKVEPAGTNQPDQEGHLASAVSAAAKQGDRAAASAS